MLAISRTPLADGQMTERQSPTELVEIPEEFSLPGENSPREAAA